MRSAELEKDLEVKTVAAHIYRSLDTVLKFIYVEPLATLRRTLSIDVAHDC